MLWIYSTNACQLSHLFTLFTCVPYKAKGRLKRNYKTLTDSICLFRNVTRYWKAKRYKMILHTDIRGSSSQEKIQTRAFTNSTNYLLIRFPILYYDKDYDVSVTVYIYIYIYIYIFFFFIYYKHCCLFSQYQFATSSNYIGGSKSAK